MPTWLHSKWQWSNQFRSLYLKKVFEIAVASATIELNNGNNGLKPVFNESIYFRIQDDSCFGPGFFS